MPFDNSLAGRVRDALASTRNVEEKRMFGGVGFLLNANLLVGVWQNSLIVRLGPDQAPAALREPHVRRFDVTGKPMKGWVLVEPTGIAEDEQLTGWIERAKAFVSTLPPK